MNWDTLVTEVTARHPDIRPSAMFGMPAQSDSWLGLVEQAIG